ncbi:fungal-specific transcription factor domain-domain-containing protein [Lobosporangium transversale]|uniref:Fungal-specific transcription factor domain-domain-containing protein n=1 Tax=Lobosporangium transversale TaxID=64571 RepID=A0A1Y2GFQ3_9FUNG|nr:fungal-specific transcription factor domain-domain-containing protein [Lobosporangium transversale]ORZ08584.1 fungal-specific transcription factor domain-domain-containing protein [Lobosporangium transversale]|eukprot:XP_021878512.1 fungal-specific transcription factor domain-domain-containing protein [Lobosporangium transversale]
MFYCPRHYGGQQSARERESQKPEALKFINNPDLPSPEEMTHLLNLHFTYVHPFAPVFVWSSFFKRLQNHNYTPSLLFLLNSIFALASQFSDDISFRSDPSKSETIGGRFVEKAKQILDTLYDTPDLYCVGGLVLLAFQQMGTGNGYRSWMYVGIAVRMAQHLGLHRDCLKLNPHLPALDREERNRIWWTCFMADKILSTAFGRPQGITENDVDATYPDGIDEENTQIEYKLEGATSMLTGPSPQSEKKFIYLVSLTRILGRVMASLYSPMSRASSKSKSSMTNPAPLEQLDKELTDWLLTLPPQLQFRSVQQEPGTFVCMLHMTFYTVLILLHRPYSHQSSQNAPNDPSISLSICTSAANNSIEMASNMMRATDEKRGVSRLKCLLYYSVLILFTAGIVHTTNCTSTDPVLAASAKLRTIETLKCLAIVEDVWMTARMAADNILLLLKARNIDLPYSTEGKEIFEHVSLE